MHRGHALAAAAEGDLVDWASMDWEQITQDFNNHFQGGTLEGDPRVRPQRTAAGLRTARARIQEVVDLTGIAPREESRKGDGGKGGKRDKGGKSGGRKK